VDIGPTFGNALVLVFWSGVGFLFWGGLVELLASNNVPVLSTAAKALVSGFHYAFGAVGA
jgi:hypothetical protein